MVYALYRVQYTHLIFLLKFPNYQMCKLNFVFNQPRKTATDVNYWVMYNKVNEMNEIIAQITVNVKL